MLRRSKLLAACLACALILSRASAQQPQPEVERPEIEVVFVVDTTGSMQGFIDTCKQKIWSISNHVAAGAPTPRLKLGLVAYRDRGEAYVTQVTDLCYDLDAIYEKVKAWEAKDGGDGPEAVNEALHDAVHKITWSTDKKVLRVIFLIGDAEPHMDYKDDVKYPETCREAVRKEIIINTVQCGKDAACQKYWKDIGRLAQGEFFEITEFKVQAGAATPFDKDLAKINSDLARTIVGFGSAKAQAQAREASEAAAKLDESVAADRAAYVARSGSSAPYDLVDNIKTGKVKLDQLRPEELPDSMRGMSPAEQKGHVDKLSAQRAELNRKAVELDNKRGDYLKKKRAEDARDLAVNSFEAQVLRVLQVQAINKGIDYTIPDLADMKKQ